MYGTLFNIAGVLLGGFAGLAMRRTFSVASQQFLKVVLGVYTVWIGLKITGTSLLHTTSFWHFCRQVILLVLALMLGHVLGRLLRVQQGLNRLGRIAKEKLSAAAEPATPRPSDGFIAATILFCAAPLAVLGSVQDGLNQDFQPLLLKAVMDGLVTMSLVLTFGWPVMLGAAPLAAFQVTLSGAAQLLSPTLQNLNLVDSVNAVCGLLIFCVSLIIFELRKIELGDYLPALIAAPLLAWVWR